VIVQQFFVEGIAHSSYLLGGNKTCAIIDPARDIEMYLKKAKDMGLRITHILETHLHADFVSGHMELAEVTGAKIYAPKSGNCKFDHVALAEGDSLKLEDMKIEVLDTPGHTPDCMCYVVSDLARGDEPVAVFTGDTLFVGDAGRPDLFPGRAEELASELFDSLKKVKALPVTCEVYPAHGAGSLCGRAMGAKRTSTVGYEKKYNYALLIEDRQEFIKSLTSDMPEAPDHFSRCTEINRDGPEVRQELPVMEPMSPKEVKKALSGNDSVIVDIRSFEAYGGAHIEGAYSLDIGGNFATFAGWIVPPEKDIILVCNDPGQAEEALLQLRRVGLDNVVGYLEGGMFNWLVSGFETGKVEQVSSVELNKISRGDQKINLVDVRATSEYDATHIEGAVNIPVHHLRTQYDELDRSLPTVVICESGHRASIGASLLKQRGFEKVINAAGGMRGYTAAGFSPECPVCTLPHGPRFLGK
jgi:glyoxylase-like metal-dependent hydrolase (beta-lactamase superfamily II)/rhodanese-related sulfurtransferase